LKIAVLFGGMSTEHDVSITSGTSVIYNLNKNKYDIYPIYISKDGIFYKYTKNIKDIKILSVGSEIEELEKINNIVEYLKSMDVVFPVLHGLYGEDGTIQGLLELIKVPYVGCKVLSSSLCMDKAYTKIIFNACGIHQAKYMYLKKDNNKYIYIDSNFNKTLLDNNSLINTVDHYLHFPVFIKPSNSGSSVGVNKVNNKNELIELLEDSFKYDNKVLIEEQIIGKEVECAVLGSISPIASTVGEINTPDYYSYDNKYLNNESSTIIPANIDNSLIEEIKKLAIKAYTACDCNCLSRIDFFVEKDTNRILINEINTMPGFTSISMYPKLMEYFGYDYSTLLDKIIFLSLN